MTRTFRTNYHTHTFRCKHAEGDVDDYCSSAVAAGLEVLGISDHTPFPDNRWLPIRMHIDELPEYSQSIDKARKDYAGQLTILKGMECEYCAEYDSFFRDELLGKYEFDYLALGPHFLINAGKYVCTYGGTKDQRSLFSYADFLVESMQSGLFTFVAHPDLFGNCYPGWDANCVAASRAIIEAAEELNLPLEINCCGIRKGKQHYTDGLRYQYPLHQFWEIAAEYDITVVVNSDAHFPTDIIGAMNLGYEFLEQYKLKEADLSFLEKKYEKTT